MLTDAQRKKMLTSPTEPVDLVMDTDAYNEIDDQYAISYAVFAPEKLRVKALYAAPFTNQLSSGPADGMAEAGGKGRLPGLSRLQILPAG